MSQAPLTHDLIRKITAEEANRVGIAQSLVVGRSNGRWAVTARRRAVRRLVALTGCSASSLARMWGTETRTITAALTEPADIAPYDVETFERLKWARGPEIAQAIVEGRHADTNADIARWRRLGMRGAA